MWSALYSGRRFPFGNNPTRAGWYKAASGVARLCCGRLKTEKRGSKANVNDGWAATLSITSRWFRLCSWPRTEFTQVNICYPEHVFALWVTAAMFLNFASHCVKVDTQRWMWMILAGYRHVFLGRDNWASCKRSDESSRLRNKWGFDIHQTRIVKNLLEIVKAL